MSMPRARRLGVFGLIGVAHGLVSLGLTLLLPKARAYRRWREETAFGHAGLAPAERRRAVMEFAHWVSAMRRLK